MKLKWYDKMIYGTLMLTIFVVADRFIIWFTKDASGIKEIIPAIALVILVIFLLGNIVDLLSRDMERERAKNAFKEEQKKHA
jgi:hypothetical protein